MVERAPVGAGTVIALSTASTTIYGPFGAELPTTTLNTTEAFAGAVFRGAGVVDQFRARVITNARASSATAITVRVNGADSGLGVSFAASATGTASDLSNSATLADGDLWNLAITTGAGTGAIAIDGVSAQLTDTSGAAFAQMGAHGSASFSTASSTQYLPFAGHLILNATETARALPGVESATISKLQVYVSSNARTTNTTYRTRVNGAAGAQSVVFGSGVTGLLEDASNTDAIAVTDRWNGAITTSTGTGAIVTTWAGVKYVGAQPDRSGVLSVGQAGAVGGASRYWPIHGFGVNATENVTQIPAAMDGLLSNMGIWVSTNSNAGTGNIRLRVAGSSVNQTISITANTTGYYSDASNTDAVTAGQLLNYFSANGGGVSTISGILMLYRVPHTLTIASAAIGSPSPTAPTLTENGGSGTDNLTIGNAAIGSPVSTDPTIAQVHVLAVADSAISSPASAGPAIAQLQVLTVGDAAISSPASTGPTLAQHQALSAGSAATGSPEATAPDLTQVHVLAVGAGAISSPEATAPTLAQVHALAVGDSEIGSPEATEPSAAETTALAVADSAIGSPAATDPALTQTHALSTTSAAVGSPAATPVTLAQVHVLAVPDASIGSPVATNPAMAITVLLVANDAAIGSPVGTEPTLVVLPDALSAPSVAIGSPAGASPSLGQHHVLAANDSAIGSPVATAPTLSIVNPYSAADILGPAVVRPIETGRAVVRR